MSTRIRITSASVGSLRSIDLRVIFDEDKQLCIVGCHQCEASVEYGINDVPKFMEGYIEFSMQHLRLCSVPR